jgi:HK97 family phage major capsid protein
MNSQILNTRKAELLASQEKMLNAAAEAKLKLTDEQELTFAAATAEIKDIDSTLARMAAIEKGKSEVGAPTSTLFVPSAGAGTKPKFSNCTAEYASAFWNGIKTRNFTNAALGEGGTAADGSFLVPAQTDPSIPNLAPIEASARKLSRVITTEMDLKIPYQSAKTTAAQKAETNNSSTNAFATSVPNFATTTLTAYMAGDQVAVSWELMQDVKALSQFVTADLQRAITNYEENIFINGTGSSQPLGYIPGATAFETALLTINNILDLVSQLKNAYYSNASFLFNRQEFHRLYKAQIAASQFQTYITYDPNGQARLLGFPVTFSSVMPTFGGSPVTNGAVLFGDFSSGFVIGDRGDSNIRVKVLDQVAAQNGQTIILGYRRTDQRCVLQEAVQMLTTNG